MDERIRKTLQLLSNFCDRVGGCSECPFFYEACPMEKDSPARSLMKEYNIDFWYFKEEEKAQ